MRNPTCPKDSSATRCRLLLAPVLLLSVLLIVCGGCASQAMNSVIASWQGGHRSEVTSAWGQPSEELKIEGKNLLLWQTRNGKLVPPGQQDKPPATGYCLRLLEADSKGAIVSGSWEGDDCPGWFSGWRR